MGIMSIRTKLGSLARRFKGSIAEPTRREPLTPAAIVEQQRVTRAPAAAMPAAAWTDDITRHNAEIAVEYAAEIARRILLFEKGEYTPRFGKIDKETGQFVPDIGYDVQFEMKRDNVTGLAPALPALSTLEFKQAATVSDLTSEIQVIERGQQDRTVTMPARPSKREVLDRVGGDESKAAQVEQRLDELFGAEA